MLFNKHVIMRYHTNYCSRVQTKLHSAGNPTIPQDQTESLTISQYGARTDALIWVLDNLLFCCRKTSLRSNKGKD